MSCMLKHFRSRVSAEVEQLCLLAKLCREHCVITWCYLHWANVHDVTLKYLFEYILAVMFPVNTVGLFNRVATDDASQLS